MEKESQKEPVILQSRQGIYNYRKRIYRMWGYDVPIDISLSEAGYYLAIEILLITINAVFKVPTLFGNIIVSVIVKFGIIPYFTVRMLKYSKLDGKSPMAFLRDYISFFFDYRKKYELFRDVSHIPEHEECLLEWWPSTRHRLRNRKNRRL